MFQPAFCYYKEFDPTPATFSAQIKSTPRKSASSYERKQRQRSSSPHGTARDCEEGVDSRPGVSELRTDRPWVEVALLTSPGRNASRESAREESKALLSNERAYRR